MSDKSAIEWTDATWNPIRARRWIEVAAGGEAPAVLEPLLGWHCEHVSEGCRRCYAEGFNRRLGTRLDYKPGHLRSAARPGGEVEVFLGEKMLLLPLRWKRPRRIFVGSMTDVFADFVTDDMLDRLFAVMALCPQHVFQVLTKRPARMRRYFSGIQNGPDEWLAGDGWRDALIEGSAQSIYAQQHPGEDPSMWLAVHMPLPNVWLGVSVEDQKAAEARIPELLATAAAVRFLSCEPLLGPLWLWHEMILAKANALIGQPANGDMPGLDWVIAGGESGPGARPMHPDWARSLRDQCAAAGVPFFFKQWGEWLPGQNDPHPYVTEPPGYEQPRLVAHWQDGGWGPRPARRSNYFTWDEAGNGRGGLLSDHREHFRVHRWAQRVGKKTAGRLLDGVEHNGMPT